MKKLLMLVMILTGCSSGRVKPTFETSPYNTGYKYDQSIGIDKLYDDPVEQNHLIKVDLPKLKINSQYRIVFSYNGGQFYGTGITEVKPVVKMQEKYIYFECDGFEIATTARKGEAQIALYADFETITYGEELTFNVQGGDRLLDFEHLVGIDLYIKK